MPRSRAARVCLWTRCLGFTFLELLLVVTMICILAAILFPVFSRASEKTRQSGCQQALVNVAAALRIYAADNYGHFPSEPPGLAALPIYLSLPTDMLQCPTAVLSGLDVLCYVYRSGLTDDGDPSEIVAADHYVNLHNGGSNYLWLDGHVKWVGKDSENWQQTLRASAASYEKIRKMQTEAAGEKR